MSPPRSQEPLAAPHRGAQGARGCPSHLGRAERIWLLLVGLTLAGAWLAETGHAGWPLTLVVAGLIAFKGRMVIDHYMEMRTANAPIRRVLYAFVTLVPLLVIASHLNKVA
jgi:hypothetical protein